MKNENETLIALDETLIALDGAILKWKNIIENKDVDCGRENCPLCKKFHKSTGDPWVDCVGCPVTFVTGKAHCKNTPYTDWQKYHKQRGHKLPVKVYNRYTKMCAQKMLYFLKNIKFRYEKSKSNKIKDLTR